MVTSRPVAMPPKPVEPAAEPPSDGMHQRIKNALQRVAVPQPWPAAVMTAGHHDAVLALQPVLLLADQVFEGVELVVQALQLAELVVDLFVFTVMRRGRVAVALAVVSYVMMRRRREGGVFEQTVLVIAGAGLAAFGQGPGVGDTHRPCDLDDRRGGGLPEPRDKLKIRG